VDDVSQNPASALSGAVFKASFHQSPEAMVLSRAADGVIVEINQKCLDLTGFTRAEVLGRTVEETGYWPDAQVRDSTLAALKAGGRVRDADIMLRMKHDTPYMLRMNAVVLEQPGERYVLFCLRDIVTEHQARAVMLAGEQALAQANEQLNRQIKLFEMTEAVAHVGHWVTYPGDPWVHISSGYAKLMGLPGQTRVPMKDYRNLVLAEDMDRFVQALKQMNGEMLEYRYHHPDGSLRWMRSGMQRQIENGVVRAELGVVQEVTAERQSLETVSTQLAFIQNITRRAPGVLYEFQTWDDGRYKFSFISAGVQSLLGLTDRDLLDNASLFYRAIEKQDLAPMMQVASAAARKLTPWQFEVRTRHRSGERRWMLCCATPDAQPDGSIVWYGSLSDITAQKEIMQRLHQSEARFRSLTELSSDWFWEQDAQFRFLWIDGNLAARNQEQIKRHIGKTLWDTDTLEGLSEAQWAGHRAQLARHETFHDFEVQRLRQNQNGRPMWVAISGMPVFDEDGVFQGYRGTGRDITVRKRAEVEIERLAFFDALTGLPNRRLLMDRLRQALEFSARRSAYGALFFIDLDNFKALNDTLGHHMGDELLKQVAARLLQCVRSTDTVARLGGDEFVVMLEDIGAQPAGATAIAESVGKKILQSLNQDFDLAGQQHRSSPSIGITLFFQHQDSLDDLLKRADLAMYQSKAAGRNTLRFFDPLMQATATARVELETDMRQGLERQEFLLYYQPVVDEQARVTGVEALMRWQHPLRGLIPPGEFIPVAEQTGLILALGQWGLEMACAQLVAWSAAPATQHLTIAVNVSARQFHHPEFSGRLLTLLRTSGANPYRLKLELTESLLLTDIEDAIVKMGELRSVGVRFALDDFGTGYSSLSYLKRLPLDQLKIDQSFVRDILSDANDAAIARTILNLAQSLDLGVVAEGVETAGQYESLLSKGCKAFQGYFFGHPVPIGQLRLNDAAGSD
jgi:diguanylate cyclase (GGDEF)-like protein/PAS domain S-box-containing protein